MNLERKKETDWQDEVRRSIYEINQMIEKLVKKSREYAKAKGVRLFLTLRKCKPLCSSCPHGPYWAKGWKGKTGIWKEREVGVEITKKKLWTLGRFRKDVIESFLEVGKRANYLREIKKVLTDAKATASKKCSNACLSYTKLMRNYEEGNFRKLEQQLKRRKWR